MIKEVFFPGPGGCGKDALRPRYGDERQKCFFLKRCEKLQNKEVVLRS